MWLPRSAIIALLTMLSAEGEKEVLLVGSKLEDSVSDSDRVLLSDLPESERGGFLEPLEGFKKGNLHQISFSLKNRNQ
jgi:hypothetical protein